MCAARDCHTRHPLTRLESPWYRLQEFDGASKRNPGPAGFGAVLYDEASGVEVRETGLLY